MLLEILNYLRMKILFQIKIQFDIIDPEGNQV